MVGGHYRRGGQRANPGDRLTTTHLYLPAKRLGLLEQRWIDLLDGFFGIARLSGLHHSAVNPNRSDSAASE
jgi:hypothetical protein